MLTHARVYALIVLCCFLSIGCGSSSGPETVPVSGKVTMNGDPLDGVEVNFIGENFTTTAITNAEGAYTLPQGSTVGQNKIYIRKWADQSGLSEEEMIEKGMDPGQVEAQTLGMAKPKEKNAIPPQYSDPQRTTLTFDVPDGGSDSANFSLSK